MLPWRTEIERERENEGRREEGGRRKEEGGRRARVIKIEMKICRDRVEREGGKQKGRTGNWIDSGFRRNNGVVTLPEIIAFITVVPRLMAGDYNNKTIGGY